MKKKKIVAEIWNGLLPNYIAKEGVCIAIQSVYCKLTEVEIVLQCG